MNEKPVPKFSWESMTTSFIVKCKSVEGAKTLRRNLISWIEYETENRIKELSEDLFGKEEKDKDDGWLKRFENLGTD